MLSEYPYTESEQGLGGIMQATFQLIEGFKALADPGLELHVVTMTTACRTPDVRSHGNIHCHFVPKGRSEWAVVFGNPLRLARYFLRLNGRLQPDLHHGQGSVSFLLLSLRNPRRSVQTIHGVYRNEQAAIAPGRRSPGQSVRFQLKEMLESFYLRRIRNLIAITMEIQRLVRKEGNPDVRIFPINNAIDEGFFASVQRRESERRDGGKLDILFVAAITPRKGLHVLIDAFEQLAAVHPALRLLIVGTWEWAPDYVAEQRARCADLVANGRIVFTGPVDRKSLVDAFRAADIFVLPSFSESAPMVISQAMCAGLPIVASAVGGIPEMIEDGATGVLVPPGETAPLAEALKGLIADSSLRQKLGDNARKVGLDRYHPLAVARQTLDVYRAVAGVHP